MKPTKNFPENHASLWSQDTEIWERQPLQKDQNTEVCVIGGGMAGLLTAYFLTEAGIRTIVLEAERIASGQTKNTTAKITCQHGLCYHRLIQQFGREKAFQYAQANQLALRQYRYLVETLHIDCDWRSAPAYLYSTQDKALLKKEYEAAGQLGIRAVFTTQTELPFPVEAALRFEHQAQFHPLKFLRAIANPLEIYEHTQVQRVEGSRVFTRRGTVTAKHIVFTSHYPFINFPGYYFARMHQERSYVLALEQAAILDGMYYGIDSNGCSFRSQGHQLLLGGEGHRVGEIGKAYKASEKHPNKNSYQTKFERKAISNDSLVQYRRNICGMQGYRYEKLLQIAKQYWPECRVTAAWSAQDCITLDKVPYIGVFSPSTPNWYTATGFQKWGMTSSMAAAMLISHQIQGNPYPYSSVFSPRRLHPSVSAKSFITEAAHSVRGLALQAFQLPKDACQSLPPGCGGIVRYRGVKAGVYKNEQGELFAVSVKCPHLGCQLSWNPDEKSWDCPCHGSRFDYRGNLIDNPAQTGLKKIK